MQEARQLCDVQRIEQAVRQAELQTSAEVRVHIARVCKGDPLDEAVRIFAALGMHKTRLRNGVLIYVSPVSRKGSILGDMGVVEVVEANFFEEVFERARRTQAASGWTAAIEGMVAECARALASHFPREASDVNELPDHVSVE